VTRRRYAIGKVVMMDGRENCLIEVEREYKALSMMVLKSNVSINWNMMYYTMLMGLVNESGKWSKRIINEVRNLGISVRRIRHQNVNTYDKEYLIHMKLLY